MFPLEGGNHADYVVIVEHGALHGLVFNILLFSTFHNRYNLKSLLIYYDTKVVKKSVKGTSETEFASKTTNLCILITYNIKIFRKFVL